MKKRISNKIFIYKGNSSADIRSAESNGGPQQDSRHLHDDFQLILIHRPKGRCAIGDTFEDYCAGDILLIGRNVPHCYDIWQPNSTGAPTSAQDTIIHFRHELFQINFDEIAEYRYVNAILRKSESGIIIRSKPLFRKVVAMANRLEKLSGVAKINELMLMLDTIGRSKHRKTISPEGYRPDIRIDYASDPVQRSINYIYEHFREEVSLADIAEYANMNKAALCRLFKQKTGATLFSFLSKIRVENACKLLISEENNISYAAYSSGFNNLAHFNRQFKAIMLTTPRQYRTASGAKSL